MSLSILTRIKVKQSYRPLKFFCKVLLVITITITTQCYASLLVNGSFEELTFTDNSAPVGLVNQINLKDYASLNIVWDVYKALPGWSTTFGHGIELQKNIIAKAQNGKNHIQLDSHPKNGSNSVMTQSLHYLVVGNVYLLQFYYKPRSTYENDNGIGIFWYEAALNFNQAPVKYFVDSTKTKATDWALHSVELTATSSSMNLSFGAFGTENMLGGLIDNVSLVQVTDIL